MVESWFDSNIPFMVDEFLGTGVLTPKSRKRQVLQFGSPSFRFRNSQLLTGATEVIDFSEATPEGLSAKAAAKYVPFDSIEVQNVNATNAVVIRLNQSLGNQEQVSQNSNKVIEPLGTPVGSILIENIGAGTISANQITIIVKRTSIDADKEARLGFEKATMGLALLNIGR